ncbi:hypothetical protein [Streptomyces decoyicus]|uniref:hypothetical protein n=1 Tax=Streptomyces decoyicus TaxID=249567 RepID=UPI00365CF1D9
MPAHRATPRQANVSASGRLLRSDRLKDTFGRPFHDGVPLPAVIADDGPPPRPRPAHFGAGHDTLFDGSPLIMGGVLLAHPDDAAPAQYRDWRRAHWTRNTRVHLLNKHGRPSGPVYGPDAIEDVTFTRRRTRVKRTWINEHLPAPRPGPVYAVDPQLLRSTTEFSDRSHP